MEYQYFCLIMAIVELLAFLIAYFIPTKRRDLISLFIGGVLFSIGIGNMLPRAKRFISGDYPYEGLVSLLIFMILTLIKFIKDGINSSNDNILGSYDTINAYTTIKHTSSHRSDSFLNFLEKALTFISNHMVIILLYIIMIFDSITNGIFYNQTFHNEYLQKTLATHIFLKFLEQIVIGFCIKETNVPKLFYWILVALLGSIEPTLIGVHISMRKDISEKLSGYSLASLLGFYFYIGSRAIYGALSTPQSHIFWSILCFLLSFIVPSTMLFGLLYIFR